MKKWIGATVVTGLVAFAAPASAEKATASPQPAARQTAHAGKTSDFSARRHHRRYHRHVDRAYDRPYPGYYARPYYYRPYPYSSPAPFVFGFGFSPSWW